MLPTSKLEETKQQKENMNLVEQNRMGGRLGSRMEKAFKKDDRMIGGIGAAHN